MSPTGVRREQYWDATGKPIARPAAPQGPLGRTMNWTFGAGRTSIEFVYRGKSSDIIRKAFGEPDEELNGVWIYRGMKVQAAQQLMTTVGSSCKTTQCYRFQLNLDMPLPSDHLRN